jgi:hypothetical protein
VDDLAPFVFEGAASEALSAWLTAYAADFEKKPNKASPSQTVFSL